MDFLQQIQDLSLDFQINNCGESIIPFTHKIIKDHTTHYKCEAKINGNPTTMSTILIDCHYITPKIYTPDYLEGWIKDFIKSHKVIMILNVALCNVYQKYGHSNVLIIDKNLKNIERFEPHGKPMNYYDDTKIENIIKQFTETYFIGFNYLSPYVFIGNKGPQTKTNITLHLESGRGLCVNYTMLYIYLRCKMLLNPYESIDFINTHFLEDNILKFTNYANTILSQ